MRKLWFRKLNSNVIKSLTLAFVDRKLESLEIAGV
jgi:hypothetical protein